MAYQATHRTEYSVRGIATIYTYGYSPIKAFGEVSCID